MKKMQRIECDLLKPQKSSAYSNTRTTAVHLPWPYVEFGGNGDEKLRFSHDNECSLSDESLPVAAHIKPSKRKPTDQATEQTIKFQYHRILSNICMKQSGFSQM